jgi:hypothetical protein
MAADDGSSWDQVGSKSGTPQKSAQQCCSTAGLRARVACRLLNLHAQMGSMGTRADRQRLVEAVSARLKKNCCRTAGLRARVACRLLNLQAYQKW